MGDMEVEPTIDDFLSAFQKLNQDDRYVRRWLLMNNICVFRVEEHCQSQPVEPELHGGDGGVAGAPLPPPTGPPPPPPPPPPPGGRAPLPSPTGQV